MRAQGKDQASLWLLALAIGIATELKVPIELLDRNGPSTLAVYCSPQYQPSIASRCNEAAALILIIVQQQGHSSNTKHSSERGKKQRQLLLHSC